MARALDKFGEFVVAKLRDAAIDHTECLTHAAPAQAKWYPSTGRG
jgi:hypothetical protein